MSFQEKRALVFLSSTLLILGGFSLFVYHGYRDTILSNPNDFAFWGKTFLILVLVSIVANIGIQILFVIVHKITTNEDAPRKSDERDKLIELKAIQITHWVFIVGFLFSMGSQAMGMQPWVMLVILLGSGFFAACVTEITKFYLYRKGL